MAALAGDAVRAGALGFSTSRTLNHRTSTGDYTPTLKAGEDELTAIAGAMHKVGRSVLQFVLDQASIEEDLPMMLRVAENTRCPISFSVAQADKAPRRWRQTLDCINEASARGLSVTAQIAAGEHKVNLPHPAIRVEVVVEPLLFVVGDHQDLHQLARIVEI
jgi:N-acyl-D-aspartate/D-glutamate deacylase